MKNKLKHSASAILLSMLTAIILIFIFSFLALNCEDPNTIIGPAAIVTLFVSSFVCGLICSVLSKTEPVTILITLISYITIIFLSSVIIGNIVTPSENLPVVQKIICYAISAAIILIGVLLGKKRKSKKRSGKSVRASMRRKKK